MNAILFSKGVLRPWRDDDAPSLAHLANDAAIAANLRDGFPHPYTEMDARRFIAQVAGRAENQFYAIDGSDGLMGSVGFALGSDVHRECAEMGYWIGAPFQGKGIATSAVTALVSHAFKNKGLTRISAQPFAANLASRRVLEKCGFALEGVLRQNVIKKGVYHDSAMYARLRDSQYKTSQTIQLEMGELRVLNHSELPELKRLYKFLHEDDTAASDMDCEYRAWEAMQNHHYVRCYGVFDSDRLIGSCVLNILPNVTRGCRPYALVENVITHPDFRRRGIGRSMLQQVVNVAFNENCYKVMLLTGRKTESVFRFYESAGFSRHEKQGFIIKPELK